MQTASAQSNIDFLGVIEPLAPQMVKEQPIPCKEREVLLAILKQAIRNMIHAREQAKTDVALKAWENARKALMEHMQEHGC